MQKASYSNYDFGESVVKVTTDEESYTIIFNLMDYADIYVDHVIDEYLAANIRDDMTDLEKLDKITAFPAGYIYSTSASGYKSMVIKGGGDCWASTSAIIELCTRVGLPAHVRYGANDGGAGSGHRNAAVLIDGEVYVAEAGYYSTKAPRYYKIYKENTGYDVTVGSDGNGKITQYDGFETNLIIPETIEGKTITTIGRLAFSSFCAVDPTNIVLPKTLTTLEDQALEAVSGIEEYVIPAGVSSIGRLVFTDCDNLRKITVDPANESYCDDNGVLYDKDKTRLLYYPTAGGEYYKIPDTVTAIEDYAFYYTDGVATLLVPASVTQIGEGAFGSSRIKKIYFSGDKPEISDYAFKYLGNSIAYYPEGNTTWDGVLEDEKLSDITWQAWDANQGLADKDIRKCTISLSETSFSYSGNARTPEVTVTSQGNVLTEGTDYEVSYENNINAGKASVFVTGIGEYSGAAEVRFTIYKAYQYIWPSISANPIEMGGEAYISVSCEEDPVFSFSSSDETVAVVDADGTVHGLAEGEATITIEAAETDNYYDDTETLQISVSKDVHNMVETEVIVADENNNKATVTEKCSVCGKEETRSFTTVDEIEYVIFWQQYSGYYGLREQQTEGESYWIEVDSYTPSDAEDHTFVLESSNPEVVEADGRSIKMVGTGEATLTLYAKYRPCVKRVWNIVVSHDYDEGVIRKEATCTEPGEKVYTCACCGDIFTEEIPIDPDNHVHGTVLTNEKPATCVKKGQKLYTCPDCGKTFTETIPVNEDHDWGEPVYEWSEDYQTVTATRVCSRSKKHIETETVQATGQVKTEATETLPGERVWTSGEFENPAFAVQTRSEELLPTGYQVTYEWKETKDGYRVSAEAVPYDPAKETLCETVNAVYSVALEPTCTQDGMGLWTSEPFAAGQFTQQTLEIGILAYGHDYTETVIPPTCTQEGYTAHTCRRCGETHRGCYAAPKGHSWDEGDVVKEASCTEAGFISRKCQVCGETWDDVAEAFGHSYVLEVTEPTCTEAGFTTHTCILCGDSYRDRHTEAKGHTCGEKIIVKEATCTETGLYRGVCEDCGKVFVEKNEALGHSYKDSVVKPTCTTKGYTVHSCTRCGDSYADQYVKAKGHAWDKGVVKKAPTVTKNGVKVFTCKTCKKTKTSKIKMLKNIKKATISGIKTRTYTGKALKQSITVKYGGKKLKAGVDYTISYKNNKNAGKATLTVKGKGTYGGSVKKTFTIKKAANKLTLKVSKKTYKRAKLKKAVTFKIGASKGNGKVTYTLSSAARKAKIKVSSKGKVTVPKKCKAGTYTITVKAAGNSNYKSVKKTVKIVVK